MYNKNKLSFNNIFFLYINMANDYFQKHKEKLQKEARAIYQNRSEKKKRKNAKKVREKYQNISEEENAKQSQYHFWETKAKASGVYENLLFSI